MQNEFKFGRNRQIVLILVLPAALGIIPLYFALEWASAFMPKTQWPYYGFTILYVGLVSTATYFGIQKSRVSASVLIAGNQLLIRLKNHTWLNPRDMAFDLKLITKISQYSDKGFDFMYFSYAKKPIKQFHLMAESNSNEFVEFSRKLKTLIASDSGE